MGFSLKKLFEEASAQVNPFDSGKTAATVRANRQPAQPAVTQRKQPGQYYNFGTQSATNVTPNQNRGTFNAQYSNVQPQIRNTIATSRFLTPEQKTQKLTSLNVPQPKFNVAQAGVQSFKRAAGSIGAGLGRSAVGTAQGVSGIVDLATPGTGTSRVSQGLDRVAKGIDNTVKRNNLSPIAYKVGQAGGDILQFAAPGAIAKGAARATQGTRAAKAGQLYNAGNSAVTRTAARVAARGTAPARIGARVIEGATPQSLLNIGAGTAFDLGTQASKGQDINLKNAGLSLGMNVGMGVGLPVAMQAAGDSVRAGIRQIQKAPAAAKTVATTAKKANEVMFTPRKSLEDQYTLRDLSDHYAGAIELPPKVLSDTIGKAREIAARYGVDLANGAPDIQLERINSLLDTVGQKNQTMAQGGYVKLPGSKPDPLVALKAEASYRSAHQIDSKTARNLGDMQNIDDVVTQVKSKYGLTNYDQKDIASLKKIIGNPEADVKIYRASPVNEINNGDWVTTSKTYANDIKRQNGGKVYEYTVKAKDLYLPANIEDNPSLARFSAFQYNQATKTTNLLQKLKDINTKLGEGGYVRLPGNASDELVTKVFRKGSDQNALYHGTEADSALSILNDGVIKANQSDVEKAVSFSRGRNYGIYNGGMIPKPVKIVVDAEKLKEGGKSKAYVDGELGPTSPGYEAEQRVNRDVSADNIRRIEIDSSMVSPQEEAAIRKAASKRGIQVVSTSNPNEMRAALPSKQGGYVKNPFYKEGAPAVPQTPTKAPTPELALSNADAPPPVKPPVSTATLPSGDINIPPEQMVSAATAPKGKGTRFANKTVQESQYVGEQVKAQTKKNAPTYTPETERGRFANTLKSADQKGFDQFEYDVQSRLNQPHIGSQDATDAIAVAQRLEAKGDDNSLRRAADIYDKLSEHLTRNGQTVQAAAILSRRTPDGMKYQALRDIEREGGKITPEIQRKINAKAQAVKKTKPGTRERAIAVANLGKEVEKNIPQSAVRNTVSVWKAGLLTGVKTTGGNILSNATFGTLKNASRPGAALVDRGISLITGKRTLTTSQRGLGRGTIQGAKEGAHTLKTGIDLRNASDKYETHRGINFKNQIAQKVLGNPAQKVFNFLGAQDQPFYYAQLKNSVYDQAKANGMNLGLRGKELKTYMDNIAQNPTEEILQTAVNEANKAVLGYDTIASKAVQGIHRGIDNMPGVSKIGKDIAHSAVDVLAPFVRVPTAFLSRTIDFTPLGPIKTALSQIARKQFDQRALSQAISEGATGTGVMALGVALSNENLLSGDYPKDPKERERWRAEKIQPNSVKLGNTWVSLNYLGPVGMLFGAGKKFGDAMKDGSSVPDSVGQAMAGFGQTLMGQSFLQGFSGFTNAITDPAGEAKSYVNNQIASGVPSIVNDFANMTDQYQRQVNNPIEAAKNKIPGARQTNNIKQDVYGNPLKQPSTGLNKLSPLRPSDQNNSPVLDEVRRLRNVDKNNKDLQVTPTAVASKETFDGVGVTLTNQQRYDLQKMVGQATQDAWGKIIKTPEYQALTDTEKANALTKLRQDAQAIAKREFAAQNSLGQWNQSFTGKQSVLTAAQQRLAQSGDVTTYALPKGQSVSANLSPADKYKQALSDFNTKSNTMTDVQKYAAQKNLDKLKVQAPYSNDVISVYNMSKSDAIKYLSTATPGVDKKKIAEQMLAYDKALFDAGISSYLKYKNGLSTSVGSRKTASSGGRKSKVASGKYDLTDLINVTKNTNRSLRQLLEDTLKA